MNFNVGNAQKSTTQASGLSFGSAAGSGGGFGFNANAASTGTTASTGGFSFGGTVQTSAAKGLFGGSSTSTGGLAFGTGATSTAFGGATPLSTPGGGFSFGQPTTDGTTGAKPNSGALAFGMQSPAQSSFGLGATAQPTVQSPFGMGATTQPSFGMGAATQAQSQPSFGMGAATQAQSQPSFGMGAATQAQSQPSFGLGTNPQSTTSSFGFGAKTQASFGLGAAQTTKPAFSFATPAPTQSGGLSFGNPVSTTVAASTTTSGFGFGLATPGFGLSTISQQPTQGSLGLSAGAGAQITSKPSSLGFGNSIIPKTLFGAAPIQSAPASNPPSFETRLGTSQAAQKPGFNLTASTLASTQVPATTNSGLQLGTKTTASTTIGTGFKLTGQTTTAAPPAFGLSAVSTAATLQPSSGMFSMNKITFSTSTTTVSNTTAAATPSTTPSTTFLTQSSSSTTVTTSTTKPTLLSAFKVPSMNIATSSTAVAATASTTTAASSTPSMTYKELEKKINKWGGELEHQERLFLQQATQVNAWNKLLIENSEKISSLNSDFERVKYDQERLDQELDFIKTQQEDLEEILLPLENSTRQKVTSLSMHTTHPADLERERTYNLADNIDGQLKRMVQDLREVIDHVNTTSTPADTANPVDQISKILSAHMDSLQWLDSNSGALQQKLDQLTKQVNDRKLEQENRYRLAFD